MLIKSTQVRGAALAAALMLVASVLFALQAALVKAGLQDMAPLELVFFRGLVCVALIVAFSRIAGRSLATSRPLAQFGLGAIGFVSLGLYFAALGVLPLVTATALNYTAPLFIALLVCLRRTGAPRSAMLLWMIAGFAGVCLVLQPSFAENNPMAVALGLGSGVAAAAGYILLNRLGQSGESERVTGFYFSLVVCALAAIPTFLSGFSLATLAQLGIVVAIGVFAAIAQLAMGRAYAIGSPMIPATLSYSTVVFSSLLGAFWWGEQLGWVESAGIALIVASGILVSAGQARARQAAVQAPAGAEASRTEQEVERQRKRYYRKNSLRSVFAAWRLAKDPQQTKYVFMIGDSQDNIAESERRLGNIADPFASGALEEMWQARFRAERYDVDALARMPADTLGGTYGRHMQRYGLRPDYYEDVAPRHRMHYLRLRIRQTHDIWHVLTGFGADEFGEVGIQGFYAAQFPNGQAAIIGAAAFLKSVLRGRFGELARHLDAFCEGYTSGKRAESLLAVKWEELWAENLESVRRRYRIEVPRSAAALAPVEAGKPVQLKVAA